MTKDQNIVFHALAAGRLIFPFAGELAELRAEAKAGPLLDDERERLGLLEAAYLDSSAHDAKFHAAYTSGDMESAAKHAESALRSAESVDG